MPSGDDLPVIHDRHAAALLQQGAIPYLAFTGTLSAPTLAHLSAPTWGEVVFLALGSTVAGMLLWNRAVLSGGTTRVSLLLYLEPAVSVAGAIVLLGEHLTLTAIAGGALILAGVAASSVHGRRLADQAADAGLTRRGGPVPDRQADAPNVLDPAGLAGPDRAVSRGRPRAAPARQRAGRRSTTGWLG